MRLSVNVDHVATLRNARGGTFPCPVEAARLCLEAGADGCPPDGGDADDGQRVGGGYPEQPARHEPQSRNAGGNADGEAGEHQNGAVADDGAHDGGRGGAERNPDHWR